MRVCVYSRLREKRDNDIFGRNNFLEISLRYSFQRYSPFLCPLRCESLPFQELSLAEERCYVVDGGRQSGQFTLQWLKLVHLSVSLSLSLSRIRPDATDSFFLHRLFASSCSHRRLSPSSFEAPLFGEYLRDTCAIHALLASLFLLPPCSLRSFPLKPVHHR